MMHDSDTGLWDIGIDVGGTFVDVAAVGPDGSVHASKHSRRSGDPAQAVLQALDEVAQALAFGPSQVGRLLHGTTIATNILLERSAAPIGVIVTRGFADVLTLGRQNRRDLYAAWVPCQTPVALMPEALRFEIGGRIDARGQECEPVDRADIRDALEALRTAGVRSAAVCLLFSHCNPVHERQVRAWCEEMAPEIGISLSSEVDPRAREFERWFTTAMDAYVKAGVTDYLRRLRDGLAQRGYASALVMRSQGGVATLEACLRRPLTLAMSGPAAAVNGVAGMLDEVSLVGDALSLDIGGTTSDLSLIQRGRARHTLELGVAEMSLRLRSVDVLSVAVGGGSYVSVHPGGGIRVGPESAGARPGPVAYGRGGTRATVTDCLLVLGILPERLAGGLMLDRGAAAQAVDESLARPLGLSVEAAALAAVRVANGMLGEAVKRAAFAVGSDPCRLTLVAAGGGGALHAAEVAQLVGIRRVAVPPLPGVAAAYGLLRSDWTDVAEHALDLPLRDDAWADMRRVARQLADDLPQAAVAGYGAARDAWYLDVGYAGQEFALEIPVDLEHDSATEVGRRFDEEHRRIRGQAFSSAHRVRGLRLVASRAPLAGPGRTQPVPGGAEAGGERALQLPDAGSCPVYERVGLAAGEEGAGPALVVAGDSTVWVPPGWRWRVDASSVLILEQA
ncbi:MAG: hydantoinase/oxoprolinase family protein [Pigmentiphaga sp.]|uniref:hydantoinase/oxoprolinase family protein n=1 Tax=Pigmentiphaga sp. TaxID=1977564 RepID=UPI0029AD4EA4|nr:hydantoinase/oxoprolinase family protein [Pigmentiphaga sp.]MDX3907598.1 hydantoinase/oxoprolinase family protein [Pigmentiphaga sp.]